MKKINYDSIKKNIKNNQNRYICITKQISNLEIQTDILRKYLSENRVMDTYVDGYLSVIEMNDLELLDYKTGTDYDKTNHLIISNPTKENPIFEVSSKKNINEGNGIIVEETRIYDQHKKIIFAKKVTDKLVANQVMNRQVVLTEKVDSSYTYGNRHYEFMYHGKECVILGIDNHYKILGDNSFTNRLELANSHIQKLDTIFESYLKSNFGLDETKTYQIKRKVKKPN